MISPFGPTVQATADGFGHSIASDFRSRVAPSFAESPVLTVLVITLRVCAVPCGPTDVSGRTVGGASTFGV